VEINFGDQKSNITTFESSVRRGRNQTIENSEIKKK
jgi:hypothetical protein